MTYSLIAQTSDSGPVVIASFDTEAQARTAYATAMRNLASGSYYADTVKDFALGIPRQARGAEEADIAMALMAQFEGTTRAHARKKGM